MKTILKTLSLTSLLVSSLFSSELVSEIGLNLGKAYSPYTQTNANGSIILGDTPDERYTSYELYTVLNPLTDICKEKNMKPTLSYTYSHNSELRNKYLLAGINKYYKNSYVGVLVGYGQLTWKYNPINNSKENDYTATAPIAGLQTGYQHKLSEKLSLNLNLKALYHPYDTKLNPNNTATATIYHDYTTSASVGLGYRF